MNSGLLQPVRGGLVEGAKRVSHLVDVAVSVIMVVYRTGAPLAESLRRVVEDAHVDEFVIVDNGSTPAEERLLDAVAAAESRVTLLRGQGNVGFARGANMGAQAAHGRVLVVLNPDAFLQPDCIPTLCETLSARPSPCLVGARVLNQNGHEQRGARRGEVTPVTTLLSLTRLARLGAFRRFEIHHEDDPEPDQALAVPTISGACFAMRRFDFFEMGGFDTGYFLHVEDVDLCWRVRGSGGKVLFQPDAEVVHVGSTSKTHPVKVEFHKGVGLARYFRKRADTPARYVLAVVLGPVIVAVSVVRPLLRRLTGRSWLR